MTTFAARFMAGLLGAMLAFPQTAPPESPVVGVGPFLHIISDLDQSLAFYHDALGLELTGPPGEHKFTDNPAVASLYGVPGKQFRAAVLKIPGSAMGIELVQWGEARKPEHKGLADPGAAMLILRVTDADAVEARATKAGNGVIRRNLGPPTLHDPDGFAVALQQSENPGADLVVDVSDEGKTTALYTNVLGFKADRDWLSVPGASVRIRFQSVGSKEGLTVAFPEPGRGMLRLQVHNIAALTESLKGAGFSVITTGGEPVTLPQGPRVIIVRDPNNFYLQPMEAK
jgi:catechol 2,3-dioxygenase-like lactoylglutathione lyase family enzyme